MHGYAPVHFDGYADPEQQVLVDRKGQKVRLKDCKVEALIYYS
jgi:hypothetical protein